MSEIHDQDLPTVHCEGHEAEVRPILEESSDLVFSRRQASDGIRQAGMLGVAGAAFYTLGLYGVFGLLSFWGMVGGAGVFGAALCYLGSVARHMFQYGNTRLGLTFTAATAFGASLLLEALSTPLLWGEPSLLMRIPGLFFMATKAFGAFLLVLLAVNLIHLVTKHIEAEPEGP